MSKLHWEIIQGEGVVAPLCPNMQFDAPFVALALPRYNSFPNCHKKLVSYLLAPSASPSAGNEPSPDSALAAAACSAPPDSTSAALPAFPWHSFMPDLHVDQDAQQDNPSLPCKPPPEERFVNMARATLTC